MSLLRSKGNQVKPGEAGAEGKKQVRRGGKAGRAEELGGDSKARVGGGVFGAGSHQSSWTGSLPLWGERGTHWIRSATAVENTNTSSTAYLKMGVQTRVHICVMQQQH